MDRDTRKKKIQRDRQKKAKQTKIHTPRKIYDRTKERKRREWAYGPEGLGEIDEEDWINPLEDYE